MNKPGSFSVLIARVSTQDSERILQTLESCGKQAGEFDVEIILADRRNDAVSHRIRNDFPQVRLIPCDATASIPEMLELALRRARGSCVVVTEDHCVPSHDWISSIARAFGEAPDGTVAVGGCVENGVFDTALDWGTFLCEYGHFMRPVNEGPTDKLPGVNIAYRRDALIDLDRELFTLGFWETTVHPVLQRRPAIFFSSNSIRVTHCKRFTLGFFCVQRFLYSRYYSGRRFGTDQRGRRMVAAVASLGLPAVLLLRMLRDVSAKRRRYREFARAFPYLVIFVVVWAAGEVAGYLFGAGDALARIE